MTYKEAVNDFERMNYNLYNKRVDYWTGELAWSEYVDNLRKSGRITGKQYEKWGRPFPYGERLKPNKRTLEAAVFC